MTTLLQTIMQKSRAVVGRFLPATTSSDAPTMVMLNTATHPVWAPRHYQSLSKEGYERNALVYRCITLISRGIASVPLLLYQSIHGKKIEIEHHRVLDLLRRPNTNQGGVAFMEALTSYLLLSGNCYIEAVLGAHDGMPMELYTLCPQRMEIIANQKGQIQGYEYRLDNQRRVFAPHQITGRSPVLHLKFFHPTNDWYGMSPIEAASTAIDQHNAMSTHNLALLQNGGRPSGALIIRPQAGGAPLTQKQREDLRHDIQRLYTNATNAGRIMVMEGDFEWKEMGLNPKDLDFVEGKNLASREIAQAFGVPPMLLGVLGDATFSNYKQARYHLWEDTIIPLFDFILGELNNWLAPFFEDGLAFGYDVDQIPALSNRREALWSTLTTTDFLTVDEKRHAVGYSPLESEDNHEVGLSDNLEVRKQSIAGYGDIV